MNVEASCPLPVPEISQKYCSAGDNGITHSVTAKIFEIPIPLHNRLTTLGHSKNALWILHLKDPLDSISTVLVSKQFITDNFWE